jgi:ADP-ribose pyrophosphatase YjhB (NUDIX family)
MHVKYCSHCQSELIITIPSGDNRERYTCSVCGTIFYQNPLIIAGCIPLYKERVLLCRRAIEPRKGYWTLPAGFMENGESTVEAARRETWEEALAKVDIGNLFSICNIPRLNQVHLYYLANLPDPEFGVGEESLEVDLFCEADVPWQKLSFSTVKQSLQRFFHDRETGQQLLHHIDL